jgi:hypothetical protein
LSHLTGLGTFGPAEIGQRVGLKSRRRLPQDAGSSPSHMADNALFIRFTCCSRVRCARFFVHADSTSIKLPP